MPTPFEHRKFTRDWYDCCRYYRRWKPHVNGIRLSSRLQIFTCHHIVRGGLDADDAGADRFLIPEMNQKPVVETFTDLLSQMLFITLQQLFKKLYIQS